MIFIKDGLSTEDACAAAEKEMTGETRKMIETVMNMYDSLAGKTLELTREIHRRRRAEAEQAKTLAELREAKESAESANLRRADFLDSMSMEIRSPMNIIIGLSHILSRGEKNQQLKNGLNRIQASGQNLLSIMNNILDHAKIEAGRLEIVRSRFDAAQILKNIAVVLKSRVGEKDIRLSDSIDPDVPRLLFGDSLRISQILLNYCDNALKFTEEGEISISVSVDRHDGNIYFLKFDVKDTGPGIEADRIDSLFSSFENSDLRIRTPGKGAGLGLTISRHLARLMGGDVGVESTYGKGSSFWFTVQVHSEADAAPELLPDPGLTNLKVLVADDSKETRRTLAAMLEHFSFRVLAVGSGAEALDAVRLADESGDPYRLAVLDWKMEDMTGTDAAKEMKKADLKTMPHIIIVSGFRMEDVTNDAAEAGISEVLPKPLTPSALFDSVMRIMGAGAPGGEYSAGTQVSGSGDGRSVRKARILLAEDNEINRDITVDLLTEQGYSVECAEDGRAAVRLFEKQDFDLILMDIQMPVMDGMEAARKIRLFEKGAEIPIIALTADASEEDSDRYRKAGMSGVLPKPLDSEKLYRTVREKLEAGTGAGIGEKEFSTPAADKVDTVIIPEIDGIDIRQGLSRILGKRDKYLMLLRKFADGYGDTVNSIRSCLDSGRKEEAERTAHTLKGISGNIGATNLQERSLAVESAIRKGLSGPDLEKALDEMENELTRVMNDLRSKLPSETETADTEAAVDKTLLKDTTERLIELLEDSDSDAFTLFAKEKGLLRQAFGERLNDVRDLLDDFDTDLAAVRLREMLEYYLAEKK